MVIRADKRLVWFAFARWGGLGALIGLVVGVLMWLDGEAWWSALSAPVLFAGGTAATFGLLQALVWWLWSGAVSFRVEGGCLSAYRGRRLRRSVPLDRVSDLDFDDDATEASLMLSGWFGWDTPLPSLLVTLNATDDRWDPSNGVTESFPAILLAGEGLTAALAELRAHVPPSNS